jgi:hypothetical protein
VAARTQAATRDALEHALYGERRRARQCLLTPFRSRGVLFFGELDTQLAGPTGLHCFGGFVVAQCYGLMRQTADIDILESKGTDLLTLAKMAGRTSPLHKRHGVYIDVVTVADVPDNYDERLTTALDRLFEKPRLRIFERHHLVLAKIVRNNDRDRADS